MNCDSCKAFLKECNHTNVKDHPLLITAEGKPQHVSNPQVKRTHNTQMKTM